MAVTSETAGLALLTFEGSALSYSAWLPSGMTIRTFGRAPQQQRDLLQGLVIGSVFNLLMGSGASILARHPLPFLAAIAGSIVGWIIYLYFIGTAHGGGPMGAQTTVGEMELYNA